MELLVALLVVTSYLYSLDCLEEVFSETGLPEIPILGNFFTVAKAATILVELAWQKELVTVVGG